MASLQVATHTAAASDASTSSASALMDHRKSARARLRNALSVTKPRSLPSSPSALSPSPSIASSSTASSPLAPLTKSSDDALHSPQTPLSAPPSTSSKPPPSIDTAATSKLAHIIATSSNWSQPLQSLILKSSQAMTDNGMTPEEMDLLKLDQERLKLKHWKETHARLHSRSSRTGSHSAPSSPRLSITPPDAPAATRRMRSISSPISPSSNSLPPDLQMLQPPSSPRIRRVSSPLEQSPSMNPRNHLTTIIGAYDNRLKEIVAEASSFRMNRIKKVPSSNSLAETNEDSAYAVHIDNLARRVAATEMTSATDSEFFNAPPAAEPKLKRSGSRRRLRTPASSEALNV
ncbi:hypothetical protein HDU97_006834 [Phlyctochytrium planicorne]|nr:hypothetical protein HDU97_006834 [Phlyctochytrium planicorne]